MSDDLRREIMWLQNCEWHNDEDECEHAYCMGNPCDGKREHGCEANLPDEDDEDNIPDTTPCDPKKCAAARVVEIIGAIRGVVAERDALRDRLAKLESEKQSVLDGMTRAITAEGDANRAYYEMQKERDALRELSELLKGSDNGTTETK